MSVLGDILRGAALVASIVPGPWTPYAWAARAYLVADGVNQARRARKQARAAAAASEFAERQQSTRSANDVGRIIYGRDLVAGSLRYWQTTGDKGQFLHLVYVMAAHECDAIETVYFNDIALPTPDASGWIYTGSFAESRIEHMRGQRTGAGTITMPNTIASIVSVARVVGAYPDADTVPLLTGYSYSGNTVTITDATAGATYVVDATYNASTPRVRVRTFLGSGTQAALSDLVSESGGKWTANHRLRGLAGVYVRLEWTQEMFGQIGVPEVKALIRGRKVYDPRTATTAWSENSALIARDYLRTYVGASATEVPDAMVATAANTCDELVTLTAGGATERRYTCNASYSTEMTPKAILESIGETMAAGMPPYAGGQFLILPGAARTATLTITNDMVLAVGRITADTRRNALVNRVIVSYPEPDKLRVLTEAPPVTNATYLAADNYVDLPLALTIEGAAGQVRAQRLGKIALERARQGLTCEITVTLDAYDAQPGDWVAVTLDRYGWNGKLFEVLQRSIDLDGGRITYALRETAAGVYDWAYGEATTVDLTPNTTLPNPLTPPSALTLIALTATQSEAQVITSGTVLTRALLTWTASSDVFVLRGGWIEIEWIYTDESTWNALARVPGDDAQAYIGPLTKGRAIVVRARPVNSMGRAGPWAYLAAKTTPGAEGGYTNWVMNSDFALRDLVTVPQRPYGYDGYMPTANTSGWFGWVDRAGRDGKGKCWAIRCGGAASFPANSRFGLATGSFITGNTVVGGVSGGWLPGYTYTVSFWARVTAAVGSASWAWRDSDLFWPGNAPTSVERVAVPPITGVWQQFKFRIVWGAATDTAGAIYWGLKIGVGEPACAVDDELQVAELMVHQGVDFPAWERGVRDYIAPLSITTAAMALNASTEPLLDQYDFAGNYSGVGHVSMRSFTYTPPVDCSIELSAKIVAANVAADAGNTVIWRVTPSGGSAIDLGSAQGGAAGSPKAEYGCISTFAASAGVQLTFDIISKRSGSAMPLYQSTVRLAVIKR